LLRLLMVLSPSQKLPLRVFLCKRLPVHRLQLREQSSCSQLSQPRGTQ